MRQPTNVVNKTPGYLMAWDQGQAVLTRPADVVKAATGVEPSAIASLVSGAGNGAVTVSSLQKYNIRLEQTTFAARSWQTNFTLPSRAASIRIAVCGTCATAGGATIDGAIIAANNQVAPSTPSGAFQALTFNRATTVAQPVGTAGVIPLVWSDWISIASVDRTDTVGALPAYACRIYSASTNTVTTGPNEGEQAYGTGLDWNTYFKAGDFVTTNQSGFTGVSGPSCGLLFAVQYIPEGARRLTVAEFNDSISIGYGITGTQGIGPLTVACQTLSYAFCPHLSGQSGRTGPNSLMAYLDVADQLPPGSIIIFRPYSRNGYGVNNTGVALTFLREAFKRFHRPVLQTGIYESATPGNNTNMQAVNAAVRTLAATAGVPLMDLEPLITAGNAATMLLGDGIHPSSAGRALLAASGYAPVIQALI